MPVTIYSSNVGGINITDSPMSIQDNQSTGNSYNYDYAKTGAITKVLAPSVLNAVADTNLTTLGIGVWHDVATDTRTPIRCAGTAIQTANTTLGTFATLAQDTASAKTTFLTSTTQQVQYVNMYTPANSQTVLWMSGGGMSTVYGYTGSQITANGCAAPTGTMTATDTTSTTGTFPSPTGSYYYGLQLRKKSTQVYSNVALDVQATVLNSTDNVVLNWTITNIDTTLYDQIIVWRSVYNGSKLFTTGSILATLSSTATTYTDTYPSLSDNNNTPRPGNTILDNSPLPSNTYNYITSYKNRLVAFSGSTIYLSDLNKPESWPLTNVIYISSGAPICGGSPIGVPSEYTTGADEYLGIWKERELWVLTGSSTADWAIRLVDKTGCPSQSLIAQFNGYVTWLGYTGVYIWEGRGRPTRISRPIQYLFDTDGDINKGLLNQGCIAFYEKESFLCWRVSHRTLGFNQLSIKLNTRLTGMAMSAAQTANSTEVSGIFLFDTDSNQYTALCSYRPTNRDELLLSGDNKGFFYQMYGSATTAVAFDYESKAFDMGAPDHNKRFKRVIVWVEKLTVNDLTLYYWCDYRIRSEYQSKLRVSLAPTKGTQPALWDIALWDQAFWDDYTADISPVTFNLHSYENNAEGISLKLKFEQLEASAPVRIHAFAVEWEDLGVISLPTGQVY